MNITSALSEISKNSSNFKQWEIEQDNTDSKREELGRRKPSTPQELKNAKALGETIIDVVDIMDQHSEDIAENVETASTVPLGAIPLAALLGSGFASWKYIVLPERKKRTEQINEFLEQNKEKIRNLLKKIKNENPKINKEIDSYQLLSKLELSSIKMSEPLKNEAEILAKDFSKINKSFFSKMALAFAIPFVIDSIVTIWGNIYTTKLQIDSSKVARFQARKVLNDPKYFVKYTPEQIEQAKKVLDLNTDKKSKKNKLKTDELKNGLFNGIASLMKDANAYNEWKATDDAKPEKIDRPLTQEELEEAQKDKEVIQRVVRKINNNAETYSENMEVASAVLLGGTPLLGTAVGIAVAKIMNVTNIIPNFVRKLVDKNGNEEAKKAYEAFSKVAENEPGHKKLYKDFSQKMEQSVIEKDSITDAKLSGLEKIEQLIKKKLPIALTHKWGRNAIFGIIGGFATGIVGSLIGLKLQKSSARAGRFVAKQELEKNPQSFIGYSDNEINSVEIGTENKKKNSMKEYLLFLPNVLKQYAEYEKYKNTTLKQDNLLKEELTKLDVSDKQLKDAKNLQRKVFNTFEQVDDKSQEYSESVEAVCEIAQPYVYNLGFLAAVSPALIVGIQAMRGKISAKSIIDKAISVLSGTTNIMNKKFFKKYLNNVAKNIPYVVQSAEKLHFESDIVKDKENLEKVLTLIKSGMDDFGNTKIEITKGIKITEGVIKNMSDSDIKHLTTKFAEQLKDVPFMKNLDIESFDKAFIQKNIPKVQKILENIPEEDLKKIVNLAIEEFKKNPDEFMTLVKNGNLSQIFLTKGLKNIMAVAGGSWLVLTMAVSYAIESWLADMQLKAGRLGVMKALESLKDPAYYANSEPIKAQEI